MKKQNNIATLQRFRLLSHKQDLFKSNLNLTSSNKTRDKVKTKTNGTCTNKINSFGSVSVAQCQNVDIKI